MNRADVIRLAREAGAHFAMLLCDPPKPGAIDFRQVEQLEKFAALVLATQPSNVRLADIYISPGIPIQHELDRLAKYDASAIANSLPSNPAQPAQMPGWRLVPVEPTEAMIDAGCEADAKEEATTFNRKRFSDAGVPLKQDFATNGQMLTIRYKAMLAAAPVCDSVQVDQSDDPVVMIAKVAQAVILAADQAGFVVTIERRPLLPLAMGNHVPVVTVWKKRGVT